MFHKVKSVNALENFHLSVQFAQGVTQIYDVSLFEKWSAFRSLKDNLDLFNNIHVDVGGYGVIWNDDLDISCDELYANGCVINAYKKFLSTSNNKR